MKLYRTLTHKSYIGTVPHGGGIASIQGFNSSKLPPFQCEEGARVVQTEEVNDRNPWHGQDVLVPSAAEHHLNSYIQIHSVDIGHAACKGS